MSTVPVPFGAAAGGGSIRTRRCTRGDELCRRKRHGARAMESRLDASPAPHERTVAEGGGALWCRPELPRSREVWP